MEQFEVFHGRIDAFLSVGSHSLALVEVTARGRGGGVEISQPIAHVSTWSGDRIVRLYSHFDVASSFEEMARLLRRA